MKKFDKKIALYQGIERKYFNSTVKLPDRFLDAVIMDKNGQVITHLMITNYKKGVKKAKKIKNSGKNYDILEEILYNVIEE